MDLITRRENLLGLIAGEEGAVLPEPPYITREEKLLYAIYLNGGGGGVTPEYVAEAIAEAKTDIEAEIPTKTSDLTNDSGYAAIDDTTAAQNKAYSSAKVEEKVSGEEITTTATGSDLTLSTSSGSLNALTVYGKSEVVDGSIKSAGEGYAVVDLGTLDWVRRTDDGAFTTAGINGLIKLPISNLEIAHCLCAKYKASNWASSSDKIIITPSQSLSAVNNLWIYDTSYTDPTAFKNSLNGVTLAYEEATPTNNTIAVKTDNSSGIDGTMAVFETGTPLYGVSDTIRDIMQWDGSAGSIIKNCNKVKLTNLAWQWTGSGPNSRFYATLPVAGWADNEETRIAWICNNYTPAFYGDVFYHRSDKIIALNRTGVSVQLYDSSYDNLTDFVASLGDAELVYELATPTTEQLTTAENASVAGLRTYEPQTRAQNNAGVTMTVEAYAGTSNGKAVADLKTELQITQSDTLTLTTSGWSNNTQTIAYAHDTAKRNIVDVDPASIEEWASCGVLATSETASGITFACKTVPENALNFRVTSMGVN